MTENRNKKIVVRTFEEYDNLLEQFQGIKIREYWPEEDDVALFEQEPEKWVTFLIYMSEVAKPNNRKAEYSLSMINRFLREHLCLVDSEKEKKKLIKNMK